MAEKAQIKVVDTNEVFEVMFNPTEYTFAKTAELIKKDDKIQFGKVKREDFTVTLFFDTYEIRKNVNQETEKISKLIKPTKEGQGSNTPPECLFIWGEFSYVGIVNKISQKYSLFLESGIPVRSEMTLTFIPPESIEEQKENKGIQESRKMWKVKKGDRLDLIAKKALYDASLWKKIAETNAIVNPMVFPTEDDIGKTIFIPHLG